MSRYYTSSAFSHVLKNKKPDNLESIAAATQRLLKTGELLLVQRDKRWFYIRPDQLRNNDTIQNQEEQSNQTKEKEA